MKAYILIILAGVFSFGLLSGATFRTVYETRTQEAILNVTVAKIVTMSLRELSSQDI